MVVFGPVIDGHGIGGSDIAKLRARYPSFVYRGYTLDHDGDRLTVRARFDVPPDLSFSSHVVIHGIRANLLADLEPGVLDTFAFHLGLLEIPTYWKTTCSPEIRVEAGPFDACQRDWLHELLMAGLGEYFWVNRVEFTAPDFLSVVSPLAGPPLPRDERLHSPDRVVVAMSGGKDSIVSWEVLSLGPAELLPLMLAPTPAARRVVALAGGAPAICVDRTIDEALRRRNAEGWPNGHTPFSSYLATLSVVCAALFGAGRVAFSNERSSNEANLRWLGRSINHQWSKSFAFEDSFRRYARRHIAAGVDYFSFLRPLYELQISRLFAETAGRYREAFRSCNRGQALDAWCGTCPKCLAIWTMLYPFVDESALHAAFGKDMFSDAGLLSVALDLCTPDAKPFECVGTREETLVAFHLAVRKLRAVGRPLPPLLGGVQEQLLAAEADLDARAEALLGAWGEEHAVPPDLVAELASRANAPAPRPA